MKHSEAIQKSAVIGVLAAVLLTAALTLQSIASLADMATAAPQARQVASLGGGQ